MTLLEIAALALVLGACDARPCDALDVDELAWHVEQACGEGPRERPEGRRCHLEALVLWGLETRWHWDAPSRGTGCGPLQVVPGRWWSSGAGEAWTPPCAELEVLSVGLAWGVELLRRLGRRWGSWRSRAAAYCGCPDAEDYGQRAVRLARRAE